ncbi:SAM-dependent methyltransferase [Actinocorallia lasiicapitis]
MTAMPVEPMPFRRPRLEPVPYTPPGASFDPTRPNIARIHDSLLGGKDNFRADRAAVSDLLDFAPELRTLARASRAYLADQVRLLSERQRITQFVNLGAGLPAEPKLAPRGARIVHVDHDPTVVAHNRALLADGARIFALQADLTDPQVLLARLDGPLDLNRPVAFLCGSVLHHLADPGTPAAALRDALVPGGALLLTHLSPGTASREAVAEIETVYGRTGGELHVRSAAEIAALLPATRLFHIRHAPTHPGLTLLGGVLQA